jgi:Mg2+-importing ATPase
VQVPTVFPKPLLRALRRPAAPLRVAPAVIAAARAETAAVLESLGSGPAGLTDEQAGERLLRHGPNIVGRERRFPRLRLFGHAALNPLVILLTLLATVEFATGDVRAGSVMSLMVLLGLLLRFLQEARADNAAARLKAMINVTATIVRGGVAREVPVAEVVPGDIVRLAAGDMIPGDVRLLTARDLFVVQGALTGESFPVEKFATVESDPSRTGVDLGNICFLGTSVESGSATGVVIATGLETYLGSMAQTLAGPPTPTAFDKGVNRFTWLMIRFMLVMVPLVFVINGLTKHDWGEAFFFAVAVAVGLTPEMLPMIVSVCLSKGALAMSARKVIVKRLNSIQNLGAMDVLCTDKTGTLTQDHVILERHCDVVRQESDQVLEMAFLNSHFQTGLRNVLDRAVLEHSELEHRLDIAAYTKLDEIPFDFTRRLMSVIVRLPDGTVRLVTKGAPEAVYARCRRFLLDGELLPMEQILIDELREEYEKLSADGFRVLAVAFRDVEAAAGDDSAPAVVGREAESDLVLVGYIAFLDPPKDSAAAAIEALSRHGVTVKVITGDDPLVSRKICREVGIDAAGFLVGDQVESMSDEQLAAAAEKTTLFARMSPGHKQRVIRALQARGHVVGFLGDGINDAPALRAADVGISVDTAVDIARESADAILLEKSLLVLEEGVLEGRKVFANILKYIRMGASSNFGNMFSVLGASVMVPFLPMAPIQILTNNLLYDFSQVPIPTDHVDPEQIARPRPWSMSEITRFILLIGPCSSVFDYTTYLMMMYIFDARDPSRAALFQTGWFVESLLTQTLIIHIIRTGRIPLLQSRASLPLTMTTLLVMAVGIGLVYSPLAGPLGFVPLPGLYWPLLLATLTAYVVLTQSVKMWLLRRWWN